MKATPEALRQALAGLTESPYGPQDLKRIVDAGNGLPAGTVKCEIPTEDGSGFALARVSRAQALHLKLNSIGAYYLFNVRFQEKPATFEVVEGLERIRSAAEKLLSAFSPDDLDDEGNAPRTKLSEELTLTVGPEHLADRGLGWELRGRLKAQAQHVAITTDGIRKLYPDLAPQPWAMQGQSYMHYWAGPAVSRAIESVRFLALLSDRAARRESARKKSSARPRHKGDVAFRRLVDSLLGVWLQHFQRPIKTSTASPANSRAGQAGGPLVRFVIACISPLGIKKTSGAVRAAIRDSDLYQASHRPKKGVGSR